MKPKKVINVGVFIVIALSVSAIVINSYAMGLCAFFLYLVFGIAIVFLAFAFTFGTPRHHQTHE